MQNPEKKYSKFQNSFFGKTRFFLDLVGINMHIHISKGINNVEVAKGPKVQGTLTNGKSRLKRGPASRALAKKNPRRFESFLENPFNTFI